MKWSGRKLTKEELLEDYARHRPQELLQFDGEVVSYGQVASPDQLYVGVLLSCELTNISGVRVHIAPGISDRDAAVLLRKIADMVEENGALQKLYLGVTSLHKKSEATLPGR